MEKRQEDELKEIKNENQVWTYINKFRKRKEKKDNNIKEEEWVKHFRLLLDGTEEKVLGCKRTAQEMKRAWDVVKKGKAAGYDEIPNEAWMYGSDEFINKLICVIGKIWNGEDMPDDWKTSIIVPLYKKGEINDAKNYRGISLLSTAYKIYTEVIRNRLEKEVRTKNPSGRTSRI